MYNQVCTVVPAHISFMEDSGRCLRNTFIDITLSSPVKFIHQYISARILRGLRIAARLGFQFSSETSNAIHDLSSSIINIDKVYFLSSPESKLTIVCTVLNNGLQHLARALLSRYSPLFKILIACIFSYIYFSS